MDSSETLELKNPPLAALLAWLVPGLGHLYQGRVGKGILFFVCIMGLFIFGFSQGSWKIVYFRWDKEEWRWHYLAQLGAGAISMPALAYKPEWRQWLPPSIRSFELKPSEEELDDLHRQYGNEMDIAVIYTVIAGLLNILVVYDAYSGPALFGEERRLRGEAEGEPTTAESSVAKTGGAQA
ncbi:MAG: DUF6677 family protein [Planctomycetota bacterium]